MANQQKFEIRDKQGASMKVELTNWGVRIDDREFTSEGVDELAHILSDHAERIRPTSIEGQLGLFEQRGPA